jgi:DNA-binding GntR family transcriptional regulator
MDDELIGVCALATRIACERMTPSRLKALCDSVEQARCLSARTGWDRKVTAYAEIVNLLVDAAADPILALLVRNVPGELYDLMITVGPGTSGLIASSRRRLLTLITAGDAEGPRVRWSSTSTTCSGCDAWPAGLPRATSQSEQGSRPG